MKVRSILALGALGTTCLAIPAQPVPVHAQTAVPVSCTSQPSTSPMQGHYTGTWHSDGDYHFAVFGTDLDLKITLDGALDTTVAADGHISGTATGKVDAPMTAYGRPDISGGVGTISGQISGVFSPAGSLLVLTNATIDMHWGTFGGGHAIERTIAMPDYSFPVGTVDCVSSTGSIAETNFPVQNIVADEAGKIAQLPGVGTATGTWQLQSDKSARFYELSQQVDSFITTANSVLESSATSPSVSTLVQQVVQPLRALQNAIQQEPDVSRCLLQRLAAWEGSAIARLRRMAQLPAASTNVENLRQAADSMRTARLLDTDCSLGTSDAAGAVELAERAMLDRAVSARDWGTATLAVREMLLSGTAPDRIRQDVANQIHLSTPTGGDTALMVARFAYAVGDEQDAGERVRHIDRFVSVSGRAETVHQNKKRKARKHRKAAPKPTPTATIQPTATTIPPSLGDILLTGIVQMSSSDSGGGSPRFSWQAVAGATHYALFVTSSSGDAIAWSWAGSLTSTSYGDTTIEGVPGTSGDMWTSAVPPGYRWSVLALDNAGHIVGMKLL